MLSFCLQAGFAMGDDMVFNDTPFTDALGTAFEAMSRQGREIFLFVSDIIITYVRYIVWFNSRSAQTRRTI